MSKTIEYTIRFYSDWHCGSGLSSGVDLDALVIKDKKRLPFIPGKTIKGLVREAVEEINDFLPETDTEKKTTAEIVSVFGEEENEQGKCFFTNATLADNLQNEIVDNHLQKYLYHSLASTAIDEKGIAEEHSLRSMEVTVPCELTGEIMHIPEDFVPVVKKGLQFIKRLGQNRNRGLGRCTIITKEEEGGNI